MSSYRRILSVVDSSDGAAQVIRRAALMARLCGATLAVASVADHPPGGNDTVGARLAFIGDATRRVEKLAGKAGVRNTEVLISERDRRALAMLVHSWQPDLVVVAAGDPPLGLAGWLDALRAAGAHAPADVLKVEPDGPGIGRRVASALAGLF